MKLKRLSIGTFNLYNLNEPGLAVYTDTGGWSQAEYDRKIDWTSRSIRLLHPNIFGFQELWHRQSMTQALEASEIANEYELLVPDDTDGTRIVCAAIVRKGLMVGQPEWIEEFPEKFVLKSSGDDPQTPAISVGIHRFSRPVLHFAVQPREDHQPIHVYVCHFKSKGRQRFSRKIGSRPMRNPTRSMPPVWELLFPQSAVRQRLQRCGSC
ncbi:endonuclease/exonuclease/phosphatase family protein [Microvirga zambiensis]|uniref:endonuclease/exonuclease/phosphatase family protein n=1 Tax=Microvirga zambiensis TaxID=1402137 RepID=UPI001FE55208|nr:hypothetical protein [Microvirga zambiensis]